MKVNEGVALTKKQYRRKRKRGAGRAVGARLHPLGAALLWLQADEANDGQELPDGVEARVPSDPDPPVETGRCFWTLTLKAASQRKREKPALQSK